MGSRRRKYTVYPVRLVGVKREGPISARDKKKLLAAAALGKNVEGEFAQQLLKGLQTQAKDDIENLVISDLRDPVLARRDAERIAKLLGLAIEDRVGETTSSWWWAIIRLLESTKSQRLVLVSFYFTY